MAVLGKMMRPKPLESTILCHSSYETVVETLEIWNSMWKKSLRKGRVSERGAKDWGIILRKMGAANRNKCFQPVRVVSPVSKVPSNKVGLKDQNLIIRAARVSSGNGSD